MTKNAQMLSCLGSLSSLSVISENPSLKQNLENLREKIEKYEFQIVVIGQFKRGKSTLINALVGENLLPTAIVPLTSIVTILRYDSSRRIRVKYLNAVEKDIEWSDLKDYVTESGNPNNQRGVDQVEIGYPSDLLKNGVQIIDTPGVGSVYQHNTDVAVKFVPRADMGIFVVTSDPPISDAELDFLKSIRDSLAKFAFVLNKIDQVGEEDRNTSLEFSRNMVKKVIGDKYINFYPLSAKIGLEGKLEHNRLKLESSGLIDLEDWVVNLLEKERKDIFLGSVLAKSLDIVEKSAMFIDIESRALDTPVEILRSKIASFDRELRIIRQEKEESAYILQGQAERLVDSVLIDDLEQLRREKVPALLEALEQIALENEKLSGVNFSHVLDACIESSIRSSFTEWREHERHLLEGSLKDVISRFADKTNGSIKKVIELSADLFDVELRTFTVDGQLAEQVEFRFSFDEIQVDIEVFRPVASHLPRLLSHRVLFSHAKNTLLEEFDKHSGRARYDFRERVIRSVRDYRARLDDAWEQTIRGISSALGRAAEQQNKRVEMRHLASDTIATEQTRLREVRACLQDLRAARDDADPVPSS